MADDVLPEPEPEEEIDEIDEILVGTWWCHAWQKVED
jgi:hypothetical protein